MEGCKDARGPYGSHVFHRNKEETLKKINFNRFYGNWGKIIRKK